MTLGEHDVHVWTAVPEDVTDTSARDHCASLLSAAETERMERFHFETDRHTYLIAHALVRTALSRYAPVPPTAWEFDIGQYGRPDIRPGQCDAPLRFNLSHTRGLVAVAVSLDRDIGVDVEHVRPRALSLDVADRYFAPTEVTALRAQPAGAQRDRFFTYWTLKESYIKARGMGLALPLDQFAFDVDSGADIGIAFDPRLDDDPATWWFHASRVSADHRLAVAARTTGRDPPRLQVQNLAVAASSAGTR